MEGQELGEALSFGADQRVVDRLDDRFQAREKETVDRLLGNDASLGIGQFIAIDPFQVAKRRVVALPQPWPCQPVSPLDAAFHRGVGASSQHHEDEPNAQGFEAPAQLLP